MGGLEGEQRIQKEKICHALTMSAAPLLLMEVVNADEVRYRITVILRLFLGLYASLPSVLLASQLKRGRLMSVDGI